MSRLKVRLLFFAVLALGVLALAVLLGQGAKQPEKLVKEHPVRPAVITAAVYATAPFSNSPLEKGVIFPKTFTNVIDEAEYLIDTYGLSELRARLVESLYFHQQQTLTSQAIFNDKVFQLTLALREVDQDGIVVDILAAFDARTLIYVEGVEIKDGGTYAISGKAADIGTRQISDDEGRPQPRAILQQPVITITAQMHPFDFEFVRRDDLSSAFHPDLHIHREKFFGPEGVDLSEIIFYTDTFRRKTSPLGLARNVQSLLVDLSSALPNVVIYRGRISFSPQVKVIGVVADLNAFRLQHLVETELIFASRQAAEHDLSPLENDVPGSPSREDYVRVRDNAVNFQLGIAEDRGDSFRILISHGDKLQADATFDIELTDMLMGGIRTGGGVILDGEHLGDSYIFRHNPVIKLRSR